MTSSRLIPPLALVLASSLGLLTSCGPDVSEEELAKLRANQALLTKLQGEAAQWAKERKQLQAAVQEAKAEVDRLSANPSAAPAPKPVEAPVAPKTPTPPPVAATAASQEVLVLGDMPVFEPGGVDLTPAGAAKLKEIAPKLRTVAAGQKIVVVGHADPIPPGKSIKDRLPDNWAVSSARAQAVIRYLVWGEGIPADRFMLEAMGSTDPVAGNDTRKGRMENQRVEIRIQSAP